MSNVSGLQATRGVFRLDPPPALSRIAPITGDVQSLPTVELLGTRIHAVTEAQAVDHILGSLETGQGGWVITPNVDHLRRLQRDPQLRQTYANATLLVADGMPLVWASRLQGTPLPERVAGSSLIATLSAAAARNGRSIYLLGGDPGVAEKAGEELQHRFGPMRIVGTHCPKMGFEADAKLYQETIERLAEARPDIVFVALGSPKQEQFIAQCRDILPEAWWLGIGISFSFLSGDVRRAPEWMQRMGLEWLHRLGQEPRRLARRYLVDGVPFAMSMLARAAAKRVRSRHAASL